MKPVWYGVCSLLVAVAALSISVRTAAAARGLGEVELSNEELKKLDTFEGHTLAKADQAFNKKQYRQARAEYDSFIAEFPRSKLIPYALLRKGRCAQLDDKRFKAIADYDEILDYFPNDVKYAAAALFYIGDCHWSNGDIEKAMKAWAEMADDKGYRKEPLGAYAINHLADHLLKQEREAEAAKYYEQVAVDFRTANREASEHARGPVIRYYVRSAPNEEKYREFFTNMKGFEHHQRTIQGDLTQNKYYWDHLRHNIRAHGDFDESKPKAPDAKESETDKRKKYYTYWSGQMQGKFPEDDDFRIEMADFRYRGNDDRAGWFQLLDEQYNNHQKAGDWKRTVKWMHVYIARTTETARAAKVEQYYRKINIDKTGNEGVIEVMRVLWKVEGTRKLAKELIDKLKFDQMSNAVLGSLALEFYEDNQIVTARLLSKIDYAKMTSPAIGSLGRAFWGKDSKLSWHILRKMRLDEMSDKEIAGVARSFWQASGDVVKHFCMRTKDKDYGKSELLSYYESRWGYNPKAGLPLADDLVKVDKYSEQAWWAKGRFHHSLKEYAKAIGAYQNCQNEPVNLWRIADCQDKLKKLESAVAQVREIENFFPPEAPRAAMHIAQLYRKAGEKKKYIGALRAVLKKYPQSGQSREAHLQLEGLGIKMGGGIDAN